MELTIAILRPARFSTFNVSMDSGNSRIASLFGKAKKLKRAVALTETSPSRTIAFGDEVRDIEAARAAGIDSGAVLWGYATRDVLAASNPTLVLGSFDALISRVTETKLSTTQ